MKGDLYLKPFYSAVDMVFQFCKKRLGKLFVLDPTNKHGPLAMGNEIKK